MDDRLMDDHFIDHVLNYKKLLNFLTRARARVDTFKIIAH